MPITDINEFFEFFDKLSGEEFNEMLAECASPTDSSNMVYAEDYVAFMKEQQKYYIAKATINTYENCLKTSYVSVNNIALAA
jgi:hypothetical protein